MGESIRGRIVSVCVSPEGWTVCFNDVCSCNIERWIYLSSILPHLDCVRINCTTSKWLFTFLLLLLVLLLPLCFSLFLDNGILVSRGVVTYVYKCSSAAFSFIWWWHENIATAKAIESALWCNIIYPTRGPDIAFCHIKSTAMDVCHGNCVVVVMVGASAVQRNNEQGRRWRESAVNDEVCQAAVIPELFLIDKPSHSSTQADMKHTLWKYRYFRHAWFPRLPLSFSFFFLLFFLRVCFLSASVFHAGCKLMRPFKAPRKYRVWFYYSH